MTSSYFVHTATVRGGGSNFRVVRQKENMKNGALARREIFIFNDTDSDDVTKIALKCMQIELARGSLA